MVPKKTSWSQAEVLESAKADNVRFLHLMFSDIKGIPKNVALPIERLEEVLESGVQFDGSSIAGFAEIQESDMILMPDANTWAILPWTSGNSKAARLICDVYKPDGSRYEGDPRYVLQRSLKKAAEMGYSMFTGPECEFYLFKKDANGQPAAIPHDSGAYFDVGFSDHGEACRNEITIYLEQMGFNIEAAHHEVGPGQHEIDFNYGDALTSADRILTLKWVTKIVAQKHGLHATFMPKPMYKKAGNGMHVHQSLWKDGKNSFYDPEGKFQLSKTAYAYMAGLLKYTPEITAVLNSTVNSYKRLVPGYEAPCYVAWANKNRSALIRVPAARGKGTRLELRCPDPSGNPYLQTAVMLMAGLRGMSENLTPPEAVEVDIYHMDRATRRRNGISDLPGSLQDSLRLLEDSKLARETLGEHIFEQFLHVKGGEWDQYRLNVHGWELETYLANY